VINDHPLFDQTSHRPKQPAVRFTVEQVVLQQLGAAECRVLVQQHRTEYRLLGFVAPGCAAEHFTNGRGLRYGGLIERD
jgi:hypothetical protein